MSRSITISEGLQAKNFSNVTKIRVNNIGGGTSDWIPEEDAGLYANLGEASITKNGTYNASDEDYDGFSKVTVKVDPKVTTKTITKNGTYKASKDKADGFSEVSVQVPTGGDATLISKSITENGTYNAGDDDADGYSSVTVNVSGGGGGTLITKNITANGTYNASSDNADGYSSVTVNVAPTHGRQIVNGVNNAPVSSRISTRDFIMDLSEKAYEIGMAYVPSMQAQLEANIRNGNWATFADRDILNYDNLVLIGRACYSKEGIVSTIFLQLRVWVAGIMDESGVVTISNMSNIEDVSFDVTKDDGRKFTRNNGSFHAILYYNGNMGGGSDMGNVYSDIANHNVGNEGAVIERGSLGITDTSLPYTSIVTNLTGGTYA